MIIADTGVLVDFLRDRGPMADSLIAGICLERDGILLTRNVKHFSRVDGLTLSGRY